MVTFRGYVKYISGATQTTAPDDRRPFKYSLIRVQDVDTRRFYWLYDWSGNSETRRKMEHLKDELLVVEGYLNSAGRVNYAVLQRWGIWDREKHRAINPFTEKTGYAEVLKKNDHSGDS